MRPKFRLCVQFVQVYAETELWACRNDRARTAAGRWVGKREYHLPSTLLYGRYSRPSTLAPNAQRSSRQRCMYSPK